MMDCVRMSRSVREIVADVAAETRVVPGWPKGRWTPAERGTVPKPNAGKRRGAASGWSVLIEYVDSAGAPSHRRITIMREEAQCSGHSAVAAFCHEANEPRVFRLDRIVAMASIDDGELIDPIEHVARLRAEGLPFVNRGMATFAKAIVFVARCDGHDHPAEWTAIEDALAHFAIRFGGDDSDIRDAICRCRKLAPDSTDFGNSLVAFIKTPADYRRRVGRLLIESAAEIVHADGRLSPEEIAWGNGIGQAFKVMAA